MRIAKLPSIPDAEEPCMNSFVRHLTAGGLLTLSVCLAVTSGPAWADEDDEKIMAAQKELIELAKTLKAGKAINPAALAAIKKKYDLEQVMTAFKPLDKKGVGVLPGVKTPGNGIEFKLINLGKRAPSKMQLDKE